MSLTMMRTIPMPNTRRPLTDENGQTLEAFIIDSGLQSKVLKVLKNHKENWVWWWKSIWLPIRECCIHQRTISHQAVRWILDETHSHWNIFFQIDFQKSVVVCFVSNFLPPIPTNLFLKHRSLARRCHALLNELRRW